MSRDVGEHELKTARRHQLARLERGRLREEAASRSAAASALASGTSAATRAGRRGTSLHKTFVMTPSVPSDPISRAGRFKPALSFASRRGGGRSSRRAARLRVLPRALAPCRAVPQGSRAAGVAGDDAADGGAVARREVQAGIEPRCGGVLLKRRERRTGPDLHVTERRVDRAQPAQSSERHQGLPVARNAAADQAGVAALRNDARPMLGARPEYRCHLIGAGRAHDRVGPARAVDTAASFG
jgi:hypothetical protein